MRSKASGRMTSADSHVTFRQYFLVEMELARQRCSLGQAENDFDGWRLQGDAVRFVPSRGTRIGGQHKGKKERITEALSDLQLVIAGIASQGEGPYDGKGMAQSIAALARTCSVFLRKLVLGEPRKPEARLLDDVVLASLDMRLQPLRKIPKDRRWTVETGFRVAGVSVEATKLDETSRRPVERYRAVGGAQGLTILVEWPLPGMAEWIDAPSERRRWRVCPEQLFDTSSDRGMPCSEWLGQQVVMFDRKGITLQELIRTAANYDGAHAVNVGRMAVVEGESPSKAAKDPEIHILRNITFFGVGYAELVVVEAALYLFERLLDEASIARPRGEIYVVKPEFECPAEQAGSSRPPWLGFRGEMMVSFSTRPGIVDYTIRGVG